MPAPADCPIIPNRVNPCPCPTHFFQFRRLPPFRWPCFAISSCIPYFAYSRWWQQRYAIDTDGYTNAWSGLFVRLLMGCCVFKVASPTGHRQWYYHRLEPWHHYVPVCADLSDLKQRIDWCRSHEGECERIANQGRALALSMDFKSEYSQAAANLVRNAQVSVSL